MQLNLMNLNEMYFTVIATHLKAKGECEHIRS